MTLIKGSLFSTDREVISHGVNCQGRFASGVAGEVAKRFPEAKRMYLAKHSKGGWKPGDVQVVMTNQYRRWVANMATQEFYGRDGKQYASYDAIKTAFETLLDVCQKEGWGVAMPLVGCGLGGCEWPKVEAILRDCLVTREVEVDVYYLSPGPP